MDTRLMQFDHPKSAVPVAVQKFADIGPGDWWFVHHPDGFLIECASEVRAKQIAYEINAGRSSMLAGGSDGRLRSGAVSPWPNATSAPDQKPQERRE